MPPNNISSNKVAKWMDIFFLKGMTGGLPHCIKEVEKTVQCVCRFIRLRIELGLS